MSDEDQGNVTALPGADHPFSWDRKLRMPFGDDHLEYKPAEGSICRDCLKAEGKVCGKHSKKECEVCHQFMTTAHKDLTYVGHAGITERLLDVDPRWTWRFTHHDVPPEVLQAAVSTGNPEIVRMVIDNAPPVPVGPGYWIELTVHDDDGNPVTRPGFGDAKGKQPGGDAVKEVIGDAIRNACIRFGVATYLWSKSDAAAELGGGRQLSPGQRSGDTQRAGVGGGKKPEVVQGTPGQAAAIALAKLAVQIAAKPDGTVKELTEKVYEPAKRKTILTMPVPDPFKGGEEIIQLTKVLTECKRRILAGGDG